MAKANRKQGIIPQAAVAQPGTVQAAPVVSSNVVPMPAVMVYDGPKMTDAKVAPQVNGSDLLQAGMALKNLAFNVLAGNVNPALFNKDAEFWSPRSLKDAKSAFFKLANLKTDDIRVAWHTECEARKAKANGRISQVSLQGLAKLFKAESKAGAESPYTRMKNKLEKLVADIQTVISAGQVKPGAKLDSIASLCEAAVSEKE
jgi:hypothetical protein